MFEFIINGLVLVSLLTAIYALFNYLKEKGVKFAWWKWTLSVFWIIAFLLVFGFIGTTIGEGEPGATLRGGAALLALLVVSGIVLFRLFFGGAKSKPGVEQPAGQDVKGI